MSSQFHLLMPSRWALLLSAISAAFIALIANAAPPLA
jgi:hypothetical protein